ncbi:hypothetical protein BZA05DRAFT_382237 [Tricharina praecox]|uniref:uncharacterized protein n=1 Tax=Tricharina praecox TaxID=43433 RepID=UPI0022209504|nr:uncharacterized protein BZA05DRAFT_382237 [Tricharina praecox]KAI5858719.1 hypothetical protein BZA05DRAFT_382237 [Tricharina praecox]
MNFFSSLLITMCLILASSRVFCEARAAPKTTAMIPTPFDLPSSVASDAVASEPAVSHRIEVGSTGAYIVCTTSWDSPLSKHVQVGANHLKGFSQQPCRQTNFGGSYCTGFVAYGTARIALCGEPWWSVKCGSMALAAEMIIKACTMRVDGQSRVAGYYVFDSRVRAVLLHT